MSPSKKRVCVYVDGFNLFHAVENYKPRKINLWSLFEATVKDDEQLVGVKYFSAYAHHIDGVYPGTTKSHEAYVKRLQSTNVQCIMGNFKKRYPKCKVCKNTYTTHEEKETDLNLGLHLLADGIDDKYDKAHLVSADSDMAAAVNMVRQRMPEKMILVVKPPGRHGHGRELGQAAHASITLKPGKVKKHMF